MRSNRCTRRRRCIPKFTPKGATSPLERCGGTRHSNEPLGPPYSPRAFPPKGKPRSTKGPLRVVTEPVQAWGKHPSIKLEANSTTPEALKYKATKATTRHTRLQGHKGSNAPQGQQRHKGYQATKATPPQRLLRHKGDKATKATTPLRSTSRLGFQEPKG